MSRREAEEFEEAMAQAADGRRIEGNMASLVQVARLVQTLADPPPPPPHGLSLGRQRLLTEAGRLRSSKQKPRFMGVPAARAVRLGTALLAAVLLFGIVFGAGQAVAGSLPGEPAYELKLAVQEARLSLTSDPAARADLSLEMAEQRLDEIETLLDQAKTVDGLAASRVHYHLERALATALQSSAHGGGETLEQLAAAIQQRQRTMEMLAGDQPAAPVRQLMREMERVRHEAHAGNGDPDGTRIQERLGTPALPSATPEAKRTQAPRETPLQQQQQDQHQQQSGQPTSRPSDEPHKSATGKPAEGQKAQPTVTPAAPTPTASPTNTPSPAKQHQDSESQRTPTATPIVSEPEPPAPPGPDPYPEPPAGPGDSDPPGNQDDPPQSPPEEPPGNGAGDPPGKPKP